MIKMACNDGTNDNKYGNNDNNMLSATFKYLNKDTQLQGNGFNNQFVDKSQLRNAFENNDSLYLVVTIDQPFWKVCHLILLLCFVFGSFFVLLLFFCFFYVCFFFGCAACGQCCITG